MTVPSKHSVVIRDFLGLGALPDSLDLRPGTAVIQTNVTSESPGELRVRPGYIEVKFDEE